MYKGYKHSKEVETMKKQKVIVTQIAATYIGTVVGAGFATGQEILQFFTRYGLWGVMGIILSSFLFIWLGTKMMLLSHHIGAYSYQELNNYLFGKVLGTAVNLFVFIILLGVTSIMLSGTGAIFKEQLSLPYQAGIIVTIVLCYIVILKGIKGIFLVNSLVVPMMLLFSVIIVAKVVWFDQSILIHNFFSVNMWQEQWQGWKWMLSALTYAAFNLAMAQAVLVPLGKEVENESLLKWGGLWGGIMLGFMLLASHFALQTIMPDALRYDIPIAVVISDIGWIILFLFLLIVYGEVFTTLIANVFGIARQIRNVYDLPERWVIVIILLGSFLISQIGFSSLVAYLYPLFGYMGLVLLFCLAIKRLPRS